MRVLLMLYAHMHIWYVCICIYNRLYRLYICLFIHSYIRTTNTRMNQGKERDTNRERQRERKREMFADVSTCIEYVDTHVYRNTETQEASTRNLKTSSIWTVNLRNKRPIANVAARPSNSAKFVGSSRQTEVGTIGKTSSLSTTWSVEAIHMYAWDECCRSVGNPMLCFSELLNFAPLPTLCDVDQQQHVLPVFLSQTITSTQNFKSNENRCREISGLLGTLRSL